MNQPTTNPLPSVNSQPNPFSTVSQPLTQPVIPVSTLSPLTPPSAPTPVPPPISNQPVVPVSPAASNNVTTKTEIRKKISLFRLLTLILLLVLIGVVGFAAYNLFLINDTNKTIEDSLAAENLLNSQEIKKVEYFDKFIKINNVLPNPTNTFSTDGRLGSGLEGTGDAKGTAHPTVLKVGDVYKMWYESGYDKRTLGIFYAESEDNLTWVKKDNSIHEPSDTVITNGRISIGTEGKGDSVGVSNPTVVYIQGEYKMWYCGYTGTNRAIYYATSPDGLTWTKFDNTIEEPSNITGTNGRIPNGLPGSIDEVDACSPEVIWDDEDQIFKMWYSGVAPGYVAMATSPDGLTWTKVNNSIPERSNTTSTDGRIPLGLEGAADAEYARNPTVIKLDGKYHMWYVGRGNPNVFQQLIYATSPDGLTWTKFDNSSSIYSEKSNGIGKNGSLLNGSSDNTLDFKGSGAADVLFEKNILYLYNGAFNKDFKNHIQTSVSINLK